MNPTLPDLPVEILHHIFRYCNASTIFYCIRSVCKHLEAAVDSYNNFHITIDADCLSTVKSLCHHIAPTRIGSLKISERLHGTTVVLDAESIIDNVYLIRLKSLEIERVKDSYALYYLSNICMNNLVSLRLRTFIEDDYETIINIAKVIGESNVRQLEWRDFSEIIDDIDWDSFATLEHLVLTNCSLHAYRIILQNLPNLRSLQMNYCDLNGVNLKDSENKRSIDSLVLNKLCIDFMNYKSDELEYLLDITPRIKHLRLRNDTEDTVNYLFNGHFWENFIREKLPDLKHFEFLFKTRDQKHKITDMKKVLERFQSPFWIEEKRWFVTVLFHIDYNYFTIYTIPCYLDNMNLVSGFEISTKSNRYSYQNGCLLQSFDRRAEVNFQIAFKTILQEIIDLKFEHAIIF